MKLDSRKHLKDIVQNSIIELSLAKFNYENHQHPRSKKHTYHALIESVIAGEEVVIAKAGKPLVKLIPYEKTKQPRQPWRMGRKRL